MQEANTERSVFVEDDSVRPHKRSRHDFESGGGVMSFGERAPKEHVFIADSVMGAKKTGKKATLSCCECRRLKLKCDRVFPCGSCRKRGVSDICPDGADLDSRISGALVSGKGTRFILANTEQLHSKIHAMSDRIRDLEDALRQAHASPASSTPHPLLDSYLLKVKGTANLYHATQGTSASDPECDSIAEPSSSSSTSYHESDSASTHAANPMVTEESHNEMKRIEEEIIRLSHSFPISNVNAPDNLPLRAYIKGILPPRSDAEYLWIQIKGNAHWQYNPHPNESFFGTLLDHCYNLPVEETCPRRLGLLFMILAIAVLVDLRRKPYSPVAETYHTVARASLCEIPVMEHTNVETILALFYEIWYLLVFSDQKKAAGYAWGLMGLTSKLAQSIVLHRNVPNSKFTPEEVERRRSLFWELLYLDARLSLSLGRPPSLSLSHMDCPRPVYLEDSIHQSTEGLHHFQEWKHSCYVHCLAPVLDLISQPNLDYEKILELDSRIRDFSVPVALRARNPQSRAFLMQKASLTTAIETVLLQLHRSYFTRVISGSEGMVNRSHRLIPSCVAVYLGASRMIAIVQDLYDREPELTARMLGYWSNTFSAAVALCLLVSRAPAACLVPTALEELERARSLFNSAKEGCSRAMEFTPMLESMIDKAKSVHARWKMTQNVPTVYYDEDVTESRMSREELILMMSSRGPFRAAHPSLVQCQIEVVQRGKCVPPCRPYSDIATLFSNTWNQQAPPAVHVISPVLPHSNPHTRDGSDDPRTSQNGTAKYPGVDTMSIELGAMNLGGESGIMAWF